MGALVPPPATAAQITALANLLAGKQPSDDDLTAIAGLITTPFGRSLLEKADAASVRSLIGLVLGTDVQGYDADLAAIAALATTPFGRSFLDRADAAAGRTLLGLAIGTNVQAFDSDLAAIAALTTTAFGRSFLDRADAAAGRTLLGLGSAALLTAGTAANNAVQLDGNAKLPPLDGSQLTNLPSGGTAVITGARSISAADTIVAADKGRVLTLSGTFTLGATAAATLGANFYCWLRKRDGNGIVTFDPNAAETVDGLATIRVYQEAFLLWPDGTAWFTQGRPKGWVPIATVALTGQSLASLSITDGFLDQEIAEVEVNYSNLICSASTTVGLRPLKNGAVIASPSYTFETTGTAGTSTAAPTSTINSTGTGGVSLVATNTSAAQWGIINARNTLSSNPSEQRIDWDGRQVGATRRGTIFDTATTAQVSGFNLTPSPNNITSISYTVKGYRS